MIRSMTGFGRAAFRVEPCRFEVEVRSVNHRYLDVRVRLPRVMSVFEPPLREAVGRHFARGKVDVNVVVPGTGAPRPRLEIDEAVARQYLEAAGALADATSGRLGVGELLALPGVANLVEVEPEEEKLGPALLEACARALAAADAMRVAEGANLERELLSRLDNVEELAARLEERADSVQSAVRERLRKRAQQLQQETGFVDEARLQQEIVMAADRLDITEEIVRLRSHLEQFRSITASAGTGEPVGRRLDFLLQELGREANTVGSKGADAPIAHWIVELKSELERLREQVQNVE